MTNTRLAVLWIALLPLAALGQTYAIDSDGSKVLIHVGKTGLGSFAGHEHDIAARSLHGKVIIDREDISRSSVDVVFEAIALKVVGKGEPPEDIPKVQSEMQGPKVLDVTRFPTIRFSSRSVGGSQVSPGVYDLRVTGEISLRGRTRLIPLPVKVEIRGNTVTARGKTTLKQTDFGIEPISAGGGLVKVEDELRLEFEILARAER